MKSASAAQFRCLKAVDHLLGSTVSFLFFLNAFAFAFSIQPAQLTRSTTRAVGSMHPTQLSRPTCLAAGDAAVVYKRLNLFHKLRSWTSRATRGSLAVFQRTQDKVIRDNPLLKECAPCSTCPPDDRRVRRSLALFERFYYY